MKFMIIDEKNRGGAAHLILAAVKSLQDLLKPSIFQSRPCSLRIRLLNTCCSCACCVRPTRKIAKKSTFCFGTPCAGQGTRFVFGHATSIGVNYTRPWTQETQATTPNVTWNLLRKSRNLTSSSSSSWSFSRFLPLCAKDHYYPIWLQRQYIPTRSLEHEIWRPCHRRTLGCCCCIIHR